LNFTYILLLHEPEIAIMMPINISLN